jgi:hypothetical protein
MQRTNVLPEVTTIARKYGCTQELNSAISVRALMTELVMEYSTYFPQRATLTQKIFNFAIGLTGEWLYFVGPQRDRAGGKERLGGEISRGKTK